jgi:hypothetical protein
MSDISASVTARKRVLACNSCGKQIEHRAGRRPRFCSKRCRQRGHYVGKVARGGFSGRTIALPTKRQKSASKLKALQRAKTLSSHRIFGPADVLDTEVFNRHWQPAASSGGVMLQVSRVRARALVAQGRRP